MSPGILESARGRGHRGGLEVWDQEGAEIVEAGEGIHSPAKVARGRQEQNPAFGVVRCLMGAPEMPEPLALGVDRGVVFVRYIGDGTSCPALSAAGTLRICPGTSKR
jgi:hypothetical protein